MAVEAALRDTPSRPGRIAGWRLEGRSLVVDFGGPALSVTPIGPSTVHARSSPTGRFARRRPWSPTPPDETLPATEPAVVERPDGVVAVLPELSVLVTGGGRVSVSDSDGRPVLVDCEDVGFEWNHRDGSRTWWKEMPQNEHYYGFGERLGPLDKRGRRYTCWTTDEWRHQGPTTDALYVAVPAYVALASGRAYGVLLDNTFRTTFDLTDIAGGRLRWRAEGGELDWYLFAGPEPARVVERLTELVGRMPLPPLWGLGFQQSRWGYASAAEILDVARRLRSSRIPADAIHLDIDHMSDRRVFTWDEERFSDPEALLRELDELGLETAVVVSACVKREPGYAVYDSGRARDVFLRGRDGEELEGWVWPGRCVFPDHLSEDARTWWSEQYRTYLDVGVRGFVNDMNEPAMHDLPVEDPETDNVEPPLDLLHGGPEEERATHAEVRNVYALLQAEGTYAFLRRERADERPFLLSRSGYAGIQRHAGTWTGDLSSVWEHLEASLSEIVGLGLSGIPFAGADVGGFFGSCGPELLVRWTQLGALMPFMRNHSAEDTVHQEPWAWGERVEAHCREATRLRYRLLPYLYTLVDEASRTGNPLVRPLFFHYPRDEATYQISDQALLGRDLLLAPVLRPGVRARAVYFPEGVWNDLRNGREHMGSDWALVEAELEEGLPLFARGGSIVPLGPDVESTRDYRLDPLELHVFPSQGFAEGRLYEDDGRTFGYERGEWCATSLRYERGRLSARCEGRVDDVARLVRVVLPAEGWSHELRASGDWDLEL